MKIATIQEAQAALAEFDRQHWRHEPGAATTILQLYVGLTDTSWSEAKGRPVAIADAGWLADHLETKRGILIEHALRLANVVGVSLAGWLHGGGPEGELFWLKQQRAWAERDPVSCSFPALIFGLRMATIFCEEVEHGKYQPLPSVMVAAQTLMEFAARSRPHSTTEDMAEFLQPFAVRLDELEQRSSGQPVPS